MHTLETFQSYYEVSITVFDVEVTSLVSDNYSERFPAYVIDRPWLGRQR